MMSCADATVGLGRSGQVALAFDREATDREAAVALAVTRVLKVLPASVLVRADR